MKSLNMAALEQTIIKLDTNSATEIVAALKRFEGTEAEETLKYIATHGQNLQEIGGAFKAYLGDLLKKEVTRRDRNEYKLVKGLERLQEGLHSHNEFVRTQNENFQRFVDQSISNHQF